MSLLLTGFTGTGADRTVAAVQQTEHVRDDPIATPGPVVESRALCTDTSPALSGLAPHTVPSHVVPSEKNRPTYGLTSQAHYTDTIDRQVSSSGTAARREDSGQRGHGSMMVTTGVAPVHSTDTALGGLYFKTSPRDFVPSVANGVTPVRSSQWASVAAQASAWRSRDAYVSSISKPLESS